MVGMVYVYVGEKGRITIPAKIRESLGLHKGDRLRLSIKNGTIILEPDNVIKAEDIKGIIGPTEVKIEEVEQALGRDLP